MELKVFCNKLHNSLFDSGNETVSEWSTSPIHQRFARIKESRKQSGCLKNNYYSDRLNRIENQPSKPKSL